MSQSLSHLKVIEVASVLAGPAVGMYFSERGAEVIKVENKHTKGDVTRSWKLPSEKKDSPISAYFSAVNWHKNHLFLNLKDEAELKQLKDLIAEADVLITNFKYGDAAKFGLEFQDVIQLNPDIIHGEISGFGPQNKRVAYDLVLQAETGFMYMNGTPESGPVKMPLAMIDVLAAHQLKEGILEALIARGQNKKAYHVEVNLYDAAVCSLYNQGSNFLMANHIPQRIGSLHPNIAPYGETFTTKDGKTITLAVGSDKQFNTLLKVLNADLGERYSTNQQRVSNRLELAKKLAELILNWECDQLYDLLIESDVPVAKVNNLEEVFKNDQARALILEEENEGEWSKRVSTVAYKISEA